MSAGLELRMMRRAVELALRGRYSNHPNPRVGCVVAHGE
jgi:diaminohydroxyphosphoribosylaminopyrimidine deaminase/5-amino-6-(5-phosphoribosylamino)uracil reductase